MSKSYGYRPPELYNYLMLVYIFAVGFLVLFAWPMIENALGVNRQTAFLPAAHVLMTFYISIALIPACFILESYYSHLRTRRFNVRYALVWSGLVAEAILTMNLVFFTIQLASPSVFFGHEQSVELVSSVMLIGTIVSVTIALTTRIPKVLEYVNKMVQ